MEKVKRERGADNFCLFRERKCAGKSIWPKVEEASCREVSGEQIRWAKAKAVLTLREPDRAILCNFNISTRIPVSSVANMLTPHPPGELREPSAHHRKPGLAEKLIRSVSESNLPIL